MRTSIYRLLRLTLLLAVAAPVGALMLFRGQELVVDKATALAAEVQSQEPTLPDEKNPEVSSWKTAGKATPVAGPEIQVVPTSIDSLQGANRAKVHSLTIRNVGTADLHWSVSKQPGETPQVELKPAGSLIGTLPGAPAAAVSLVLDDGVSDGSLDLVGYEQFLWFNRFTPPVGTFPLVLDEIWVLFEALGVQVGDLVDLYVYEDADGDGNPGTGAQWLASFHDQAVQATDGTWSVFPLVPPVSLNGPGDVLIAVVNRTAGTDPAEYPAAIDRTSSQGRSWIGSYLSGAPGDPPVLPADDVWRTIDSLGIPGNWMIRGYGRGGCTAGSISWVDVSPTEGTTEAGALSELSVTFDSTGLPDGIYDGGLCVHSDDLGKPLVAVPLSLTVYSFADVPFGFWAYDWIHSLYEAGVTAGCNAKPLKYCPENPVTRSQMAVFLLKAKHTASYLPPPCTPGYFADVPCPSRYADWIQRLAVEGISVGCGGGKYCPDNPVPREQMALFLLKAKLGSDHVPPAPTGVFGDVPVSSPFTKWIEELASLGITSGCGGGNYCPGSPVTRGQMAVFLVKTFELP